MNFQKVPELTWNDHFLHERYADKKSWSWKFRGTWIKAGENRVDVLMPFWTESENVYNWRASIREWKFNFPPSCRKLLQPDRRRSSIGQWKNNGHRASPQKWTRFHSQNISSMSAMTPYSLFLFLLFLIANISTEHVR